MCQWILIALRGQVFDLCNIRLARSDLLQALFCSIRVVSSEIQLQASWPLISILMHHLLNEVLEFNYYCHRLDVSFSLALPSSLWLTTMS